MKKQSFENLGNLGRKSLLVSVIAGITIYLLSFFVPRFVTFDLSLLGHAYLLSKRTLFQAAGLFLLLTYLVYTLNKRTPLVQWMVPFHIACTILPVLVLLGSTGGLDTPAKVTGGSPEEKIAEAAVLIFIAGQVVLFGNLISGLLRLSRNK